jgi:hypothetical protein
VAVPNDHAGALVVAETGGKGFAGIVSRDGDYAIFNLAAAHYTVTAYSVGHVYTPKETDVAASDVTLDLALASDAPGSISGSVNFINASVLSNTSVVAFVESTFDVRYAPDARWRGSISTSTSESGATVLMMAVRTWVIAA